jgi:hypothetical protein
MISGFVCTIFGSGLAAVGNITPWTGWTGAMERDHGSSLGGSYYKNSITEADTLAGWTASSDDGYMIAVAVEDSLTGTVGHHTGFGRGANEFVDNRLRQQLATTNYGTDTSSAFGALRADGAMFVGIFTVPTLGATLWGNTCDSAKIRWRMLSNSSPINDSWAFQILRPAQSDWSETQSTWRLLKTGEDWADSGASSTTTDIFSTNYSTFTHTSYVNNADMTVPVTDLIKAVDGADTNSSFTIRQISGDGVALSHNSGNCSTVGRRVVLQVWWHTGIDAVSASSRRRRLLSYKERIDAYSIRG